MAKVHIFWTACVLSLAPLAATAQTSTSTGEADQTMALCVQSARDTAQNPSDLPSAHPKTLNDCIGVISTPCMETPEGMSTVGMSECMGLETEWWDGLLNTHYARLREGADEETALALRDAQRAWIAFRDAECDLHYTYWREGTIRSTFYSSCLLRLTANRAIELEDMVGWGL